MLFIYNFIKKLSRIGFHVAPLLMVSSTLMILIVIKFLDFLILLNFQEK